MYNIEKQKYSTVQQLNEAPIVKQLNGGRNNSMPYRNLRYIKLTQPSPFRCRF